MKMTKLILRYQLLQMQVQYTKNFTAFGFVLFLLPNRKPLTHKHQPDLRLINNIILLWSGTNYSILLKEHSTYV